MANKPMSYPLMEKLVALSRRRGFLFQSSEIYDGINAVYDYGPLGVELKRNIKDLWWHEIVRSREDILGMDTAILMHPRVWEASGHVNNFHDPMTECKKCRRRYRVDHLPEGAHDCPECGGELAEAKQFNLMFRTKLGSTDEGSMDVYLRPETAQGIFVNFANVVASNRVKLPFGIAQLGKAFRNEITTGNFIFRTREFEQMEMEFFIRPGENARWLEYWAAERLNWYKSLGISPGKLRLRAHDKDELAHYSSACYDVEYEFPYGFSEVEGIADRGTYDLDQHIAFSRKKLDYIDQENGGARIVPAVIETSAGVDRTVLTVMTDAFREDPANERIVMRFSPKIAPFKAAVFPLFKKDGMPEIARELYERLRKDMSVMYDDGGSIGKRYRRQDEIGTPYCLTVDHDTLEDHAVTLRDRDSLEQIRIPIEKVLEILKEKIRL
ncbi:MAG: glycine--tRNA ligase [Candidatus Neomarinimicrobiota bacterium]|jgi:glycyl-tRNA synthetase|nr:glycine--tRNA ligase [Candidatus Neomarinimicrobiota bacterium]MDD3966115.1 glycine--tRNA ligase [Candidatus Neomarinimicrobiota bacterium]MDX9779883.1 glycine--tRNA ligase [bacterium]